MSATDCSSAPVAGIVIAAGRSRRFGSAKQLARFAGKPLLEHALIAAAEARLTPRVVVLGFEADRILERVDLHGATPVVCEDWHEGQSASLIAGIEAVPAGAAAVVTLGDQPLIAPAAIETVITARDPAADAVRASYAGRPGHPVLLERRALERALRLRGDLGASALFGELEVRTVSCDGLGSPIDIDTPGQLTRLEHAAEV
jgi:CTP:molybdopterin cytidylyltransferase MocA